MTSRRDLITLLGGAVAAWPLAARAQQRERVRRVAVMSNTAADDPEGQLRNAAFLQGMERLGWTVGRNVQVEYRLAEGGGTTEAARRSIAELVALAPDVILTTGSPSAARLQQTSSTTPIVFVEAADPVGAGVVESLARPGRNATGFTNFEYGFGGKWVQFLKEVAPNMTRIGVLRDPVNPMGPGMLGAIQAMASLSGLEVSPIGLRDSNEIEQGVRSFARDADRGLIVTPSALALVHRALIIAQAAQHRLPAIYPWRVFAGLGGLISYGPDAIEVYRQAAGYVDRILKGEKPADLPVQAPTKYELVINLKTAKTLGLTIPITLLGRADEVIE
jgi:putative ABC transport system substrate-binding protein